MFGELYTLLLMLLAVAADSDCTGALNLTSHSVHEYAKQDHDKSLVCFADNFCGINWEKDGKPIEFDDQSKYSTIKDGQILIISTVDSEDQGNYTCIVKNKTASISATMQLRYYESYDGKPQAVPESSGRCDEIMVADIGDNVTFVCRFFVGDKKDETISTWFRLINSSALNDNHTQEELVTASTWILDESLTNITDSVFQSDACPSQDLLVEDDYLLSCFYIYNVTDFAYGQYVLSVTNGDLLVVSHFLSKTPVIGISIKSPEPTSFLVPIIILGTMSVLLLVVWQAIGLDVRLYWKDNIRFSNHSDEATAYHAYICCSWSDVDGPFAVILKERLERENYRVWLPAVDAIPGNNTMEEMCDVLEQSQRFILILSPDCLGSRYQAFEVNVFMEKIAAYRKSIICVVLGDVAATEMDPILKHIIKTCVVVKYKGKKLKQSSSEPTCGKISYGDMDTERHARKKEEEDLPSKMAKELLLKMPPKPRTMSVGSSTDSSTAVLNGVENGTLVLEDGVGPQMITIGNVV